MNAPHKAPRRVPSLPVSILHMQGTFEPGGKEARIAQLINHWGGRARHDILISDPAADGGLAVIDPALAVRKLDGPRLGGPPGLAKFLALAGLMSGYDLVCTYNWGAIDAVMAHRWLRRIKALPPLVHHEDGFNADEADALKPQRNAYRRTALRTAHALVVPSCSLARIAMHSWHVKQSRIWHIPNGIAVDAYAGPPAFDAIPGLVRSQGKLLVGTLAGLRPVKNLHRLLRAVAPLRDRLQPVLVGDGPERAALLAEARALGIDDLVMPGHLPDPQRFIGLFDIFALSSDSEQFPIALVEAMAAGLPIVATDVGDVAQMVSPCNRAYVLPLGDDEAFEDALAALADDPAERTRIGASNRARARECYAQERMIERYAKVYGEAMGAEHLLA